MKTYNFDLQLQLKRVIAEYQSQNEALQHLDKDKSTLLEKFNSYGEHIQKANQEIVEKVKDQFKDKIDKLKEKISDMKDRELQLESEKDREKKFQVEIKNSYEQVMQSMKEDMRKIKEEWERRLSDEELEHQRKLVE